MTSKIVNQRVVGDNCAVVTVISPPRSTHRRSPCEECPWRKDSPVGAFPAQAFRESAVTACDMADTQFSCHMSGSDRPATCAGFLLSQGRHNLAVRIRLAQGEIDPNTLSSPVELYPSYRAMAVANGVAGDDPALSLCRDDGQL